MPNHRALDDVKRTEICALVTAGMSLAKIANYVGCHPKTIRRERKSNPEFNQRIRSAQMAADLKPLETMRHAASTHWRAAAWLLEREDRNRERRQLANTVTRRDVEKLASEIRLILMNEVEDMLLRFRLQSQLERTIKAALKVDAVRVAGPPTAEESIRFLQQRWAGPESAATPAGRLLAELVEALGHSPAEPTVPRPADAGTDGAQGGSIENEINSGKQGGTPIEGSQLADERSP